MTDIDDATVMGWNEANDHANEGAIEKQQAPNLAILVTREDGGETRIGPIFYEHVAEQMVRAFEGMRTNTEGAAGARFEIVGYDENKEHLSTVSAMRDGVLLAMYEEGNRADGPFPDLWSRLHAQHGYDQALRAWSEACRYLDAEAAEAAEEDQREKELRDQIRVVLRDFDPQDSETTVDRLVKLVGED